MGTYNMRCPACGNTNVQCSVERSKHGCLWFLLFGAWYLAWVICKWCIGLLVFILWDWWVAIIVSLSGKGYVWKSKGWFSGKKRIYYCHHCGHNFKG